MNNYLKTLTVTLAIIVAGCHGVQVVDDHKAKQESEAKRNKAKPQDAEPPNGRTFTPADLLNAYESNEISADQRYKGKRMFLQASVEKIGRDALGKPYIILRDPPWKAVSH